MATFAVRAGIERPAKERQVLASPSRQYKDLLVTLTARDIKIRYKQSVMGFFWAVLMPILIIGSGLVVILAFSTISGRTVNRADVFSIAIKAVPWAFFVGSIRFATNSLIVNKELVTKIYFPREILPLASVLANLFDLAVASIALTLAIVISGLGISIQLLWVPLLLGLLIMLTTAFGLLLSCANLFFRDVKYLVEVGLTYGIFFTPVFYSASTFGKWRPLLLLNPLGPLFEGLTSTIVHHRAPDLGWVAYSAAWSVICLIGSWLIFKRVEATFAENV
jgi:lipopolysaccharide transport system permease protein